MNAIQPKTQPAPHAVVVTLSRLLERLDRTSGSVGADQYRTVATRLAEVLSDAAADDGLRAVLDAYPSAAELYENLNYQYAGLCRSGLDASMAAEAQATVAIAKAAGPSPATSQH